METNEIKEAMVFFAINLNRGDGFWARRWNFFELINNRGDTVTTDEMIHQSDEMIQYLSWPSKAADLICLWRLKLNINEQYLSVNDLSRSCPIFM